VQMKVEFWSTSFAAPKPPNMNQVVELKCNYPPLPSVTQKNDSLLFSSAPRRQPRAVTSSPRRPSLRQGRLPSVGAHPPRRQGRLPDTTIHLTTAGVRFSATEALPLLHWIPSHIDVPQALAAFCGCISLPSPFLTCGCASPGGPSLQCRVPLQASSGPFL
jgi:hypothetical protein